MKKLIVLLTAFMMTFSLAGCNQSEPSGQPNSSENSYVGGNSSQSPNENSSQQTESDNSTTEPVSNVESTSDSTARTPITLTVGEIVLNGYLNGSVPAQSLIAQLPMTVSLNDSDNDFCGGNLDIKYSDSDVISGYNNGDLSFWTPANNFVIFVSGEENSADTGVIL